MGQIETEILTLRQVIKNHVLGTLERCEWNVQLTASKLRMSRTTILRYLRQWKVKRER